MRSRLAHLGNGTVGQLFRFGVATGLSAMVSLGVPAFLHEILGVEQKLAVAAGQVSVLLLNFVTIRMFVFRGSGSGRGDFLRYLGSAAAFRGLEYLAFLLLFELVGLFYLTALLITLGTSTLIKFAWYRFLFADRAAPIG